MSKKEKAKIILRILNKIYPKVPIPLNYRNKFTLLVSVLLSAQCTDINVNNVTKSIYPKYNKPIHFVKLGRKKIERLIKKIGIFRIKAKSIFYLSKKLVEKYRGKFLIRGGKTTTNEGESSPRTVVIEFPSYNQANLFYNSREYQEAHEILKGYALRHHQTIEGV